MTIKTHKKIKSFASENWKELPMKKGAAQKRYAISDHGRIVSYNNVLEEGNLLKTRLTQRYPSISIKVDGKNVNYYIHRLVATHFATKPSANYKFVIHLDHKKENNKVKNLKWVTHAEQIAHAKKDPSFAARMNPTAGSKLNSESVATLKKKIQAGKTPIKILAKQFKVSEMQVYRIKSGANWSHIKI